MERLRIATRQSKLALWQAHFVQAELQKAHPGLQVELVGITTRGDRWLDSPLAKLGGKGLFIKELEAALLEGRAEIAVHSMKDVPAQLPEGFVMPVIGYREDVRDALVSRQGAFAALPEGARIGSSSLRRQSQLLARRTDLEVLPIRGNVDTRLAKLEAGEFDAIVLAMAGLKRLGLHDAVTEPFAVDDMLPAGGQGALGIECVADHVEVLERLAPLVDPQTAALVETERAVSAGLGADCTMPLGAHAVVADGGMTLRAVLASPDGGRRLQATASGSDGAEIAGAVVKDLEAQGARELLEAIGGA